MTRYEDKKGYLPLGGSPSVPYTRASTGSRLASRPARLIILLGLVIASYCFNVDTIITGLIAEKFDVAPQIGNAALCPQEVALKPQSHAILVGSLNNLFATEEFRQRAVNWLSGAVKIPTESFDVMGAIGTDERWEQFGKLHDYLSASFPRVYSELEVTKVNTYGLVYRWIGQDDSLKPILFMGHQDVVPVNNETAGEWTHPPFSGHYDGERVWGRGSVDDKSGLIGLLSSFETLLASGFKPQRTVFLATGFDEEISGHFGAEHIGKYLLDKYGKNSFALLIDEGAGYSKRDGVYLATPAIAEKGYLDVRVQVSSPGGHSSVPPPHTSIGILASAIVAIEAGPFTPVLTRTQPVYSTFQCIGEHAPDLSSSLKKNLRKSLTSDHALKKVEKELFEAPGGDAIKALVGTTQAVDIISGGVKVNALPEQASAIVNHRISTDGRVQDVIDQMTSLLVPIAKKYNLAFDAFGVNLTSTSAAGILSLSSAYSKGLEPAPITPTTGENAEPYKLLAGTIRGAFAAGANKRAGDDAEIVVAPGMMGGNTDTKHFWNLTRHIFRYGHINGADTQGVHTVNEAIRVDAFVDVIRFFSYLVLNADESRVI